MTVKKLKERIQKYIRNFYKNSNNRCIICGSTMLNNNGFNFENSNSKQKYANVSCMNCGSTWVEVFSVKIKTLEDVIDNSKK